MGLDERTELLFGSDGMEMISSLRVMVVGIGGHSKGKDMPGVTFYQADMEDVDAIAEANARGSGVASLKGKMIDKPVVARAQYLLEMAERAKTITVEEV